MAGLSQPHMHNVLKGVRSLSPEYADRLIAELRLSLLDLMDDAERPVLSPSAGQSAMEVAWIRGSVGPSCALEERVYPGDVYPVARTLLASLSDPILVTLGHDPLLFPYFQAGDTALIDRQPITGSTLDPKAVYLVKTAGGTLVRSLRIGGTRLYLITPSTVDEPRNWSDLPLLGRQVSEVVWGRLVWLQRDVPAFPARLPPLSLT